MEITKTNLILILLATCVMTLMVTWLAINEIRAGEYVELAKRYKNLSSELGLGNVSWATRMADEFCARYELIKMDILFGREEYSKACREITEKRSEFWPWDAGYIYEQSTRDIVAKERMND